MRLIFFTLFVLSICSAPLHSQGYLWPTDSGNYLSSTFGETRSQHFHAGLDIKTWGREGYRVFASRKGSLHRLLVTERGYGNAIYLKHPDGTYTVYAHLQRFNDPLQALADSIRIKDYSFEMDATFDSLNIEIEQGDVIGFTGSTGIGPPHLHFEIRDSLQNPVNALTSNLHIKDELPPVFTSVIVEPLEQHSRINGRPVSYFTTEKRSKNKKEMYDFGKVKVSGKAGLAVNVYDRANEVHNAYAAYSLALLHKSDTLFYQELNTFSYDVTGEMYLDRITPFGSTRRGHQRLYAKEGGEHPFQIKVSPRARIQVSDSARTYTIIAADYFGNTSKAQITFVPDTQPSPKHPEWDHLPKDWYWSENWVSPDLEHTIDLTRPNIGFPWAPHQQILFSDSIGAMNLARIYPGEALKVTTPDRRMQLRFKEEAFFDTLSITAGYSINENEINLSVQPQMLAARSEFRIAFYLGDFAESGHRYRLFRKRSSGKLSYVNSRLIGKTVYGHPSQLGEFVITADNEAPEISNFTLRKTAYGRWLATVRVIDKLSGINSSSAQFFVNGKRGIAEYDYEEKVLIYYLPDFKPEAENTAEIYLEDKAGNATSERFTYYFD